MTVKTETRAGFSGTVGLYSLTMLASALLMFALQPMVGKMLLPLAGGTPAGWIVAMAFFQVMLLAGYYLAHFLSRFTPRIHGLLYIAFLCLGAVWLPIHLGHESAGALTNPADVFRLLTVAVAVPFIALSTTSSTIQRLFASTTDKSANDPYFLYAASNLGSFAGLLLYPLLVEPFLGLSVQSQYWLCGYLFLIVTAVLCLMLARRSVAMPAVSNKSAEKPVTTALKLQWILLSFIPSSLMMSVTTHITTDIVSAPMIWVLPLAVYLFTFILAFGKMRLEDPERLAGVHAIVVVIGMSTMFLLRGSALGTSWFSAGLHIAVFGVVALACHLKLAKLRPLDHPQALTSFYLMLAIGGALGGLLNAFILPLMLDRIVEYPLMLVASLFINQRVHAAILSKRKRVFTAISVGLIFLVTFLILRPAPMNIAQSTEYAMTFLKIVAVASALLLADTPRSALFTCMAFLIAGQMLISQGVISMSRNFYGVIKIGEQNFIEKGESITARYMTHGTTVHGMQARGGKHEKIPTTYYHQAGPVGDIFKALSPRSVAVIGLGAGTLNCYSAPNRDFTFIEIDPAVVKAAREQFTFLSACKSKKEPEIIIGDGRLEIEKIENKKFDLIVLDAFSSDSIPLHLLTVDAVRSYLEKLTPNGILLFNISNRYFDLAPVMEANALQLKAATLSRLFMTKPEHKPYASDSRWLAMAPDGKIPAALKANKKWVKLPPEARIPTPWTDDYSNLLGVMNAFNKPYLKRSDAQ